MIIVQYSGYLLTHTGTTASYTSEAIPPLMPQNTALTVTESTKPIIVGVAIILWVWLTLLSRTLSSCSCTMAIPWYPSNMLMC